MRDQGIEDLKYQRRQQVRAAVGGILTELDQRVTWPKRMRTPRGFSYAARENFALALFDEICDMCTALGVTTR